MNCAASDAQKELAKRPEVKARLIENSKKAARLATERSTTHGIRYLMRKMNCAKDRCRNPNNRGWENYGGRGIEFRFDSPKSAALWVIENLGHQPPQGSLDRIDNDGHYEPGNLRWADRAVQNSNKRQYKRTEDGERIRRILSERSDYTYEGIRTLIKKGLSDDDILSRRKGSHLRHP